MPEILEAQGAQEAIELKDSILGQEQEQEPAQAVPRNQELAALIFEQVKSRLRQRAHVPTATYRVQLNKFFTFSDAQEQVEYLHRLGVSDLYVSPYFKASPESLHGYDIANHNELNPSIGTEEEYTTLVEELRRNGMYTVLDMVPNHMGIGAQGNTWWSDVLENGQASIYAPYFDIDWDPINPKINDKVLLPVLGRQYGEALENGELQVEFLPEEGRFNVCYYEKPFPISPATYDAILALNIDTLDNKLGLDSEIANEYRSILTALAHLPSRYDTEPLHRQERNREKEIIKKRLATLSVQASVRDFIENNVRQINGLQGDPHSFDTLDALLERQPYRLSFWRVATEEINYRRFFDVNELAAIRIDEPAVFEESHRMVMRFLREDKLDGLRIDHVDGLRDPAAYFQNLQRAYFLEMSRACMDEMPDQPGDADHAELETLLLGQYESERATDPASVLHKPLYVVVEKILARGEALPADWLVDGTTGYEFTNEANGLYVDTANGKAFDEIYASTTGEQIKFADLVYTSKKEIMQVALSSEVNVLTNMLNHISEGDRHYRDFTLNSIRDAIGEVVACFPVYRTYITREQAEPDKRDQGIIAIAISRAKKRNPATDPSIFDFLGDILLLKGYDACSQEQLDSRYDFVLKFQQVTGPVTAKGIEDTAFYIYNRLISLNEVGGEPGYFGNAPANFHRTQAERQRHWPNSLLTTSTHDTKRSEDVRMRIDVLSEMPKEWSTAVRRWMRFNRKLKKVVDGAPAPSANEEYFLYETLLGVWPFEQHVPDREYAELIERVQAYMRKAMNEAKVHTSWVNTNEPYQQAVADFIAAILARGAGNRFLADFLPFPARIAHYGAFNSLSQVLLKITGPGVPDIYQGNEIWDLSMVDPDNRRPVDYALRRRLLAQVEQVEDVGGVASLIEARADGRVKLFVTSRALQYRRDNLPLFQQGSYTALQAEGKYSENIIAFARTYEGQSAIIIAPCLFTRLGKSSEMALPVGSVWSGGWLLVPGAAPGDLFRNVFTGETVAAREHNGSTALPLDEVLSAFPLALLQKQSTGDNC